MTAGGRVVGSELIGQNFTSPQYLHPRPSAAGKDGYDATASGGTNKGPTDADLAKAIAAAVAAAREDRPGDTGPRPGGPRDHLGLGPRPAPLARRRALAGRRASRRRAASRRRRSPRSSGGTSSRGRSGLLGEPRVNVLLTNLDLDRDASGSPVEFRRCRRKTPGAPPRTSSCKLLEKSRRGKLKIYIGHAAGVGKTYQMLEDAHALQQAGRRRRRRRSSRRTAAPRRPSGSATSRSFPRRTRRLQGQGARGDGPARRSSRASPRSCSSTSSPTPTCPGAENEKRYQDVEDLLDAGISVMTTVNIQHFESVQDIVSRVTGVDVQERVPDRLLRQADAHRQRGPARPRSCASGCRPGRSIPPSGSGPALENFFTRGEPRVAARARDAPDRRPARGRAPRHRPVRRRPSPSAPRPWSRCRPTPRRRACCCAAPRRSPGKLNTNWFAVYVRTPRDSPQRMSAREHRLLSENVTLAMELGAKVVWLVGRGRRRRAPAVRARARRHARDLRKDRAGPWWLRARRAGARSRPSRASGPESTSTRSRPRAARPEPAAPTSSRSATSRPWSPAAERRGR